VRQKFHHPKKLNAPMGWFIVKSPVPNTIPSCFRYTAVDGSEIWRSPVEGTVVYPIISKVLAPSTGG